MNPFLSGATPGEVHRRVDDQWLTDYAGTQQYTDMTELDFTDGGRRQRPKAILIGRNQDNTSTTAVVHGVLFGENHNQADTYQLSVGVVHWLAFKFIYAAHTTARGIRVFG